VGSKSLLINVITATGICAARDAKLKNGNNIEAVRKEWVMKSGLTEVAERCFPGPLVRQPD